MRYTKDITTIDQYITQFPETVQIVLQTIRKTIQNEVPEATETISYSIPTFKLGKPLVHFAAYKTHIGFYPGTSAIEAFKKELKTYKTSKGTIQFPLDKTISLDLILKIVKYRVSELNQKI